MEDLRRKGPSVHIRSSARRVGRSCCKQPLQTLDQPAFEVAGFGVEGGADQEYFAIVGDVPLVIAALVDLLECFFRRALQFELEHDDPFGRLHHGVHAFRFDPYHGQLDNPVEPRASGQLSPRRLRRRGCRRYCKRRWTCAAPFVAFPCSRVVRQLLGFSRFLHESPAVLQSCGHRKHPWT